MQPGRITMQNGEPMTVPTQTWLAFLHLAEVLDSTIFFFFQTDASLEYTVRVTAPLTAPSGTVFWTTPARYRATARSAKRTRAALSDDQKSRMQNALQAGCV